MLKHFLLIAFMFMTSFAGVVHAADKDQQKIQYDVYAGGIHALQAKLDIDQSKKGRYSTSLYAKTYGLLGKLAPWEGTFESHGWRSKANVHNPETHKSTAVFRDDEEIKTYSYNKNGSFKSYRLEENGKDKSPKKVDDELVQNTSDILAATLNTLQGVGKGEKCSGSTDIFDGKRRYTLVFKHKRDVELESSRWNAYQGAAQECTIEVRPVAGKWYEKPRGWMSIQEQGRERGKMPTVWLAQISEGQPAVPVKVRVKTAYGTLFMHMTHYEGADTKLKLK